MSGMNELEKILEGMSNVPAVEVMKSKGYSSKLEEVNYSRYAKRFKSAEARGELFEPLLNRYHSILRVLKGEVLNDESYFTITKMLREGCNVVNRVKHYNVSDKVKQIYHVNEWENLLEELANEPLLVKMKVKDDFGAMSRYVDVINVCESNNGEYLQGDFIVSSDAYTVFHPRNLLYQRELKDRIRDLYRRVNMVLARESYNNIKYWEPDWKYRRTELYNALLGIKYFSESGKTFDEFLELFRSRKVRDFEFKFTTILQDRIFDERILNLPDEMVNSTREEFEDLSKPLSDIMVYLVHYKACKHICDYRLYYWKRYYHSKHNSSDVYSNDFSTTSMFGNEGIDDKVSDSENSYLDSFREKERLENINTEPSSNNSDNEDFEVIRKENEKLKKDNAELKATVSELRGVVDTMSSNLNNVQKQLDELFNRMK